MSRRRTKRRSKRTQRGRGVGAVMALLAPVLARIDVSRIDVSLATYLKYW